MSGSAHAARYPRCGVALEELREPASVTVLAARLGESRQRLNYHLREMEKSGLVLGCAVGGSRPEHRGH
ncbi:helix-turn-helix domain-containing protein [Streptomyces sp. NPDC059881]|uniref:helix-turn-helix domain-containing protein n=1 Tax=Streptomyces sp. NPDC059881 TaxID=3346986 RepID=UPI00364E54BB